MLQITGAQVNRKVDWHSKREPIAANVYDVDKKRGKALPERVYDQGKRI